VLGTTLFWTCHLRCTGPHLVPRHFARLQTSMFSRATTNLTVLNAKRKRAPPRDSLSTVKHECCSSIWRFGISEGGSSAKIRHHVTFPELPNVESFTSPDEQHSENPLDYALYALPDSKTRTKPEQVARHSAPTVAEPAEEPLKSHTIN